MFTYLALNIASIAFPLSRSFESKIQYFKKWKALFIAMCITAFVFLVWDYFFTKHGVWSFNHDYVVGIYMFLMPLEEWMFFFAIPFACIFIYECVKYYDKKGILSKYSDTILYGFSLVILVIGFFHTDKLYTSINAFFAVFSLFIFILYTDKKQKSHFIVTYLLSLIPFLIVNGVLTFLPVVSYNNAENLGIRIFTIPVEDTVYSMSLLLMNITIYEYLLKREKAKS